MCSFWQSFGIRKAVSVKSQRSALGGYSGGEKKPGGLKFSNSFMSDEINAPPTDLRKS